MTILDRIILLLTGIIAIYMLWHFFKKQKDSKTAFPCHIFYMISFAVLLVAGLLLIFFGWKALGNDLVAIVAGLIPFGLAVGLVSRFYDKFTKNFMLILVVGLVLIAITRFANLITLGKIVYPLFHAIAGLTIFFVPLIVVKKGQMKNAFAFVTLGGTLIGLGGIALAFISAGKQLLFFSPTLVTTILAPLLFLTTLCFAIGLLSGDK